MAKMEILTTALDAIRTNPDKHWQGDWVAGTNDDDIKVKADNGDAPPCGTTLCMAGWIAFQNAPAGSVLQNGSMKILNDGPTTYVPDFAEEVADLTRDQAGALFYSASTTDELAAMVGFLAENPRATRRELCDAADIEWDGYGDD